MNWYWSAQALATVGTWGALIHPAGSENTSRFGGFRVFSLKGLGFRVLGLGLPPTPRTAFRFVPLRNTTTLGMVFRGCFGFAVRALT